MKRNWTRFAAILMLGVLIFTALGTSAMARNHDRVGDIVTFGSYPQDGPWPYSDCIVNAAGVIDNTGPDLNSTQYGIRPAMWVWVGD